MVLKAMFEQLVARAARDECRDEHVRVEHYLHETRWKTS